MGRRDIGRAVRLLRRRRGWTQQTLSARSGLSVQKISRIECDRVTGVDLPDLRTCVESLGGYLLLDVRVSGESVSELADAEHAAIQSWLAGLLTTCGWRVRVEASFNHYGERGRHDLLAFHPTERLLLAAEVKTLILNAQETMGRLDVKHRTARRAAIEIGWNPAAVVPALVVLSGRTARRHVSEHAALFARLSMRGRQATAWMRRPRLPAPEGILLFIRLPGSHHMRGGQRNRG
jgi:transcriptional regulator with XRE-family HTH domain